MLKEFKPISQSVDFKVLNLSFFFPYRSHEEAFKYNPLKSNLFINRNTQFVYSVIY